MSNLIRTIVLFTMLSLMSATATADVFYDMYRRVAVVPAASWGQVVLTASGSF